MTSLTIFRVWLGREIRRQSLTHKLSPVPGPSPLWHRFSLSIIADRASWDSFWNFVQFKDALREMLMDYYYDYTRLVSEWNIFYILSSLVCNEAYITSQSVKAPKCKYIHSSYGFFNYNPNIEFIFNFWPTVRRSVLSLWFSKIFKQ